MTEAVTPTCWRSFDDLPRAWGPALIRGRLRARPEDFIVDEELAFGPDGQGEHCLVRVRKTDANTEWVARQLAACAGIAVKMVGFAGLKDRRAVTTQWFSLHLPNQPEPDWSACEIEGVEVLEVHRHSRKLRRGAAAANAFEIRLREIEGDLEALVARIDQVAQQGVPNYFGPQRFGRGQNNLRYADALFRGLNPRPRGRAPTRQVRGLWLSAARSQLFNETLALRVEQSNWQQVLPGERLQLRGSRSHFLTESPDAEIQERVAAGDIQPTGPLFGAGAPLVSGRVQALEAQIAEAYPDWIAGLVKAGLVQERRALSLMPEHLMMHPLEGDAVEGEGLLLRFTLPSGSFATALLRELVDWVE